MSLPAHPNTISLAQLQTEFGGSNPISLSEYYSNGGLVPAGASGLPAGVQTAIPSSGTISLGNFHGSAAVVYSYEYTTGGTRSIVVPALPSGWPSISALVWVNGAGGGGGGAAASPASGSDPAAGGGGGGGGSNWLYTFSNVTPGATVSVSVGSGGSGGVYSTAANPFTPAGNGGDGGGTSVSGGGISASVAGGGGGGGGNLNNGSGGQSAFGGGGAANGAIGLYAFRGVANGSQGGLSYMGIGGSGGIGLGGTLLAVGQTGGQGSGGGGGGADQSNANIAVGTPGNGGAGADGYATVVFYNPSAPAPLATGRVTFTASTTWVVPAGITQARMIVWGGGGGGGGTWSGYGGNAAHAIVGVTPGSTLTITVGTGGAGNATGAGARGATSGVNYNTTVLISAGGGNGGTYGGYAQPNTSSAASTAGAIRWPTTMVLGNSATATGFNFGQYYPAGRGVGGGTARAGTAGCVAIQY